jgi:hypothetical protein
MLLVVDRLLDDLVGAGDPGGKQRPLAHRLKVVAGQIRFACNDRRLRLRDQCALQVLLLLDGRDGRLGSQNVPLGLVKLGAVVVVLDLHQQVAGLDPLEIIHKDMGNIARHFCRQRRQVGGEISIVGALLRRGAHPPIPFVGHDNNQSADQQQNEKPYSDADPSEGTTWRSRRPRHARRIGRACNRHLRDARLIVHGTAGGDLDWFSFPASALQRASRRCRAITAP